MGSCIAASAAWSDDSVDEARYGSAFHHSYCGRCAALIRLADDTAGNLRGWTVALAGSVKAITESLGYGLISDSPVNGIRCRVAQVRVENAPIPTVAKMFRQRMNAGCRLAVSSLLGWRIDPR